MITLDSSALVAAFDTRDSHHDHVVAALDGETGALVIPVAVMSEVAYFVEQRAGQEKLAVFLQDILDGAFVMDCEYQDWARVQALVRRYADLPLGLADAVVIECAERYGGSVMTLDRRHFGVVAREGTIEVLPHGV